MARYVFHSFHYDNDCTRTQLVRNMNVLSGNRIAHPNEWQEVKKKGDATIRKWIDDGLNGRSCLISLIGSQTAYRPWCLYEIRRAWELRKGVLGIHIHNLKNIKGEQSYKGPNPCTQPDALGLHLGGIVPVHDPAYWESSHVYGNIAVNIERWIEDAIAIRLRYR